MKKIGNIKTLIIIVLLIIFFPLNNIYSQNSDVILVTDKNIAEIDDVIILDVIINSNKDIEYVRDNDFEKNFKILEKKIIENSGSNEIIVSYKLEPKRKGTIQISSIEIILSDGRRIQPKPVSVEVIDSTKDKYNLIEDLPDDKKSFVKIKTNKNEYYKGEEIILEALLYSIYPIEREYSYKYIPDFDVDFWEPVYDDFRRLFNETEKEYIDNIEYYVKIIDKRILYPKTVGSYTFGTYEWTVKFGTNTVYDTQYLVKSNKKKININPLPQNPYHHFDGAVGVLELDSDIDGYLSLNESGVPVYTDDNFIEYNINLKGKTNPDIVGKPFFSESFYDEFKIVSENIIPKETYTKNGYEINYTYEYLIQSKNSGLIKIPGISFIYFNTDLEKYIELKSDLYQIEILYNDNTDDIKEYDRSYQISKIKNEINDIKKTKNITNQFAYYINSPSLYYILAYVLFTSLLIPLAIVIYKKRAGHFLNLKKLKEKRAYNNSLKRLEHLRSRFSDKRDVVDFYKNLKIILKDYIKDKTSIDNYKTIKTAEFLNELNQYGINKTIIDEVHTFINKADYIIYLRNTNNINNQDCMNDFDKIKDIIFRLDHILANYTKIQ